MVRKSHRRRGAAAGAVLVVLVLALLAGGIWYFVFRSTPEKTVTDLLEAARAGNEQAMREHLTGRSPAENNLVVGLTGHLSGEATREPQYTIGEAVIIDDRATVPVTFPVGANFRMLTGIETFTMPYVLHREGQTWLVDTQDSQAELARQFTGGLMDIIRRFILSGAGFPAAPDERPL